jgi:hypothetical protein
VATRVPSANGTGRYSAWAPFCPTPYPVDAGALVAGLADLAGVVGGEAGADHELAGPDVPHLAADLLHDADVLVAHRRRLLDRIGTPVGPQVRAADTGRRQPDDGVGRFDDLGIVLLLQPDVAGAYRTAPRIGKLATHPPESGR